MMAETGCDAVMVGRAAIGNPFIFRDIVNLLDGGSVQAVTLRERFDAMASYVAASVAYLGETTACFTLRSRLGWFTKGLPQAAQFRNAIRQIASETEAHALVENYRATLLQKNDDAEDANRRAPRYRPAGCRRLRP
jgi:tRNA-dihydrouridine synthase